MADVIVPGYRFATVSPDDHAGILYIAAFLTFTYSTLTFLTRCAIKWQVFGFDDWATCVAQSTSVVQFALLLVSLSAGLGRNFDRLTTDEYSRMASSQYANQIVLYLSLGLSKCAAVMLIQRLFTRDAKKFWLICNIVVALMFVWTLLVVFMVSIGCSPRSTAPPTEAEICPGIYTRYQVVAITDAITDVFLVLVPTYLVWQLQMAVSLKMQVVAVFAFRLPLIPLSFLALTSWNRSLHSNNPGVDRSTAILFQQSELCFSLIAGTVPCLKSFIRSFDTGSGVKVGYTSNGYGSSGGNQGLSYRMQSLNRDGSTIRSRNEDTGDLKVSSRPFTTGRAQGNSTATTTTVYVASKPKEEDAMSHGSQELFIRRDVQFEVRSETA